MISTLPSFHDNATKPEKQPDHHLSIFTIDQLLNPLASFETYYGTDDESLSADLSSTICATCEDCRVELSRLVSDYEEDEEGIIRCQECAQTHNRRKVQFAEHDSIILIPSHRDYTDEEYYGMWTNPDELQDSMRRNRMEYKFEGHWKLVLEEDKFILCTDGELYHPVTVRLYLRHLERQQQVAKEEARRLTNRQGNGNDNDDSLSSEYPSKESNNLPQRENIIVPNLAETIIPRLTASVA
jgi:hypothetical protein